MKLKRLPLDIASEVSWTKTNEFFHAYSRAQLAAGPQALPAVTAATNEFPWVSRAATLPIPGNVAVNTPLLLADNYRNLIVIQNNSEASSPDTAPVLFIALDGPVQSVNVYNSVTATTSTYAYNAITLQPEEGLLLDTRVWTNAIYVSWGAYSNAGGTAFVSGILQYGRTANSPPLPPSGGGGVVGGGGNALGAKTAMQVANGQYVP